MRFETAWYRKRVGSLEDSAMIQRPQVTVRELLATAMPSWRESDKFVYVWFGYLLS